MHQLVRFVFWAALILVPVASLSAEPRCALIDVDQTALGGLLEAELLTLPNTQWVERTEIQKLRDEQRLQSLYSAQSGDARRSVGTLLKADVLIILQMVEENKKKYADLVVAETNQGIRLVRQKLLLGKDPANDAELLAQLAQDGITKSQTSIQHIFAVPPLVNNDLTYEYDYLKATYAKLLERTLLDSPGVVVVELDEAKAITNEYVAAGSGDDVARKLPVYVLGEYRNQGRGEDRRVKLSLKTQQGSKVLGEKEETLKPDSVPDVLLKYAEQLASSQGIAVSPIAPQQEVKVLNERASLFVRLANWDEAQALVEASLLLVPDQPEMHSQAVTLIQQRIEEKNFGYIEEMRYDIELYRRAFRHLQVLMDQSRFDLARLHERLFSHHYGNWHRIYIEGDPAAQKLEQIKRDFRDRRHKIALQLADGLAKNKYWKESGYVLSYVNLHQTPKQKYAAIKTMLLKHQHLASNEYFTRSYILPAQQKYLIQSLEGRAFLQDLIDTPEASAHVRHTAQAILDEVKPKPAKPLNHLSNDDSLENDNLTFHRVSLEELNQFYECESIGGPWDMIRSDDGYYLYSQEHGLRKIWDRLRNAGAKFSFDGKYVWAAVRNDDGGIELVVIEPETGKRHEFTKDHGLPLLTLEEIPDETVYQCDLLIVPVDIGRAIAIGYVGRTWFADITFDVEGNHQVKIFHEAKETLPADKSKIDPQNLSFRFSPISAQLLIRTEDGKTIERGIAVVRNAQSVAINNHPIMINPDKLTIRVLDRSWGELTGQMLIEGELYARKIIELRDKGMGLFRRGLGDEEKKLVASEYDEGIFCYHEQDKALYLAGKQWRKVNRETGEITSLGPVPWVYRNSWKYSDDGKDAQIRLNKGPYRIHRLIYTRNFGLVAMCSPQDSGDTLFLQVLFDGSGKSFRQAAGIPLSDDKPSSSEDQFQPLQITGEENLWQSSERITDLAYFPDGKSIVTVSTQRGKSVRVWNAASGAIIASLWDDPKEMICVAVSPSGEYFATGTEDGRVLVWDAGKLRPIRELTDLKKEVTALAFSQDSRRLASTCSDGDACVWDLRTGRKMFNFYGWEKSRGFGKLAFTPDNRWVLSIQDQSPVWVHDAETGTDLGKIETFEWIAGFLPDGSLLGTGRDIENNLVRRQPDGVTRVVWPEFPGSPIAISNDARFLATYYRGAVKEGNYDSYFGRVEIWDAPTKTLVFAEEGLREPKIAFSPDGASLVLRAASGVAKKVSLIATDKAAVSPAVGMPRPTAADGLLTPMRTWTDTSGRFQIKAALVKQDGNAVILKSDKGDRLTVPISILSNADRQFLKELTKRN